MLVFLPYYLKANAMGISGISLKSQKYGRTGKRAPPSPRLNILTTGPPILLSYGFKHVFITIEDIGNYLEINISRDSLKTLKEFPGWQQKESLNGICVLWKPAVYKNISERMLHKSLWRPVHTKVLFTESKANDLNCQDINHSLEIAQCKCQVIIMGWETGSHSAISCLIAYLEIIRHS